MLSKKAKYGLKALIFLAKEKRETPIMISEISEKEKIPKKFLEVILLELKKDGILQSTLGKSGGYNLRQDPNDINMGHVIRLFDGPVALTPCVTYKYYRKCDECTDEETCSIRSLMKDLREVTVNLLDNTTLSQMVKKEKKMVKSLARKK
ncbi:MAG: Rrf2 family transcriptional regulator [Bacteroidota bacterium]